MSTTNLNAWSRILREKGMIGIKLTKAQKRKMAKFVNSLRARGLVIRDGNTHLFIDEEAFVTALPEIEKLKLRIGRRQMTVTYANKNHICLL